MKSLALAVAEILQLLLLLLRALKTKQVDKDKNMGIVFLHKVRATKNYRPINCEFFRMVQVIKSLRDPLKAGDR